MTRASRAAHDPLVDGEALEAFLERLTPDSCAFARAILARRPELARWLSREEGEDGDHLLARIPSPTGDEARTLILWMESDEPSVAFGAWHTHATVWAWNREPVDQDAALVALIDDILSDHIVLAVDEASPDWPAALDLREPDALLDELTRPGGSGRVRLLSWTGSADR